MAYSNHRALIASLLRQDNVWDARQQLKDHFVEFESEASAQCTLTQRIDILTMEGDRHWHGEVMHRFPCFLTPSKISIITPTAGRIFDSPEAAHP